MSVLIKDISHIRILNVQVIYSRVSAYVYLLQLLAPTQRLLPDHVGITSPYLVKLRPHAFIAVDCCFYRRLTTNKFDHRFLRDMHLPHVTGKCCSQQCQPNGAA